MLHRYMQKDEKGYRKYTIPGINWEPNTGRHPLNSMPEPYEPISWEEALRVMFTDDRHFDFLDGHGFGFRQVKGLVGTVTTDVMFYSNGRATIGVATIYTTYLADRLPDHFKRVGLDSERTGGGHYVGFYRIGCKHKNIKRTHPAAFKHCIECLDCGWNSCRYSD